MPLSELWGFLCLTLLFSHVSTISEREWAESVLSDWSTNGQCLNNNATSRHDGPGLAGRCGAQAFVIDLTKPPSTEWPAIAGDVQFYNAIAGGAGQDASMFPFGTRSMYEIGSTTKAYTTVLTEILIEKGLLSWAQNISSFFPEIAFNDPQIASVTLSELSTHTSGLPARPWNLPSERPAIEPYANFSMAELQEFLRTVTYGHGGATPKGEFIYCNDGFGLLGVILERVTGKGYEELLVEYILDPLQLNDTSVSRLTERWNESGLVPLDKSWMSPGHDKYSGRVRVRRQPYGVFKANGALKSTAGDMMRWLQAALLAYPTPNETAAVTDMRTRLTSAQMQVTQAIKAATAPVQEDCPTPPLAYSKLRTNGHVARAWQNYWSKLSRVVWKSGNTRGFGTFMAYDWARGRAAWGYDTCGGCDDNKLDKTVMMLLEGLPEPRKPASVTHELLQKFVGDFYFNSCTEQDMDHSKLHAHCEDCHEKIVSLEDGFKVTMQGDQLMAQRTHWAAAVPLEPFEFTSVEWAEKFPGDVDLLGFKLTSPDRAGWINPEHRNKGRLLYQAIDNRLGSQEIYFLLDGKESIDTLVFHSGGIDSFAIKDKSKLPGNICGVGSHGWDGMCK